MRRESRVATSASRGTDAAGRWHQQDVVECQTFFELTDIHDFS